MVFIGLSYSGLKLAFLHKLGLPGQNRVQFRLEEVRVAQIQLQSVVRIFWLFVLFPYEVRI